MPNVTTSGPNRRVISRKACLLTVMYRTTEAWHPATAMDLSQHGCRLRLGEDLARGTKLTVQLESPELEGIRPCQVEVEGNVIWSRLEGLSYQVGIHFTNSPWELEVIVADMS